VQSWHCVDCIDTLSYNRLIGIKTWYVLSLNGDRRVIRFVIINCSAKLTAPRDRFGTGTECNLLFWWRYYGIIYGNLNKARPEQRNNNRFCPLGELGDFKTDVWNLNNIIYYKVTNGSKKKNCIFIALAVSIDNKLVKFRLLINIVFNHNIICNIFNEYVAYNIVMTCRLCIYLGSRNTRLTLPLYSMLAVFTFSTSILYCGTITLLCSY